MLYTEKQLVHFSNWILGKRGIDLSKLDVSHADLEDYKQEGHWMPMEPGEFAKVQLYPDAPIVTGEVQKVHLMTKDRVAYDIDVAFEPNRITRLYKIPPGIAEPARLSDI